MRPINFVVASLMVLITLLSGCNLNTDSMSTPTPIGDDNRGVPTDDSTWVRPDPATPKAPPLLEKSSRVDSGASSELQLKPDWEIASIEYVYTWWGLGEPGLENQFIQRDGTGYKLGTAPVASENVQALIKSLNHLYPAQMLMQGHAWTDDYPSWTVEIIGTDGQHVLLMASSTGNPGNGPWNVLYNGRLYAQYDGSVAKPIGQLFGGRLGKDNRPDAGSGPTDQVNFSTVGLPPQLIYGFWGLLPISNGFSYTADADKGEIKGQIVGGSRIGSMEIGQIKELKSLQLSTGGEGQAQQVSCKIV
jgi:hypothetical protein